MVNLIALAVPLFFLLIGGELLLARHLRRKVYRLGDAIGDLGCGIGQQLVLVLASPLLVAGYAHAFQTWRVHTFESGWAPWLVALVGVDFIYYWWHRLSHRVSILWAGHVVHHQSEDYNLAVALRQAVFSPFTSYPFFLPLAFLGVPPLVYVAANGINTLYQFWIHTELVGKLGPLEWVLNTPSHHRVHHAVNARYLDKNYAGMLIVWDRMFGTFVPETERPIYGVTKPLSSFNPVWAQVAYLPELWRRAVAMPRPWDRLKVLVMPPDWNPNAPAAAPIGERAKYDPVASPGRRLYALLQFIPLVVVTFLLMFAGESIGIPVRAVGVGLVLFSLAAIGALLDGRPWGWSAEASRLGAVVCAAGAWAGGLLA